MARRDRTSKTPGKALLGTCSAIAELAIERAKL
jgi:hypothetical protein